MRIYTKSEFYLVADEKISQEAISKARYAYGNHKPHAPREIRMSRQSFATMCQEVNVKPPERITNESIQGMLINVDSSLSGDVWMIGYSDETQTEVRK